MRRSLIALLLAAPAVRAESPDEFFETRVRPLLVAKCHGCHAGTKSKGGLRLDGRDAVLKGGDTGPAATAGDPGASLLVQAVRQTGDLKMPPDGRLTAREVADLERWVRLKLPWPNDQPAAAARTLWSLRPVGDPPVPAVKDTSWPANAIDRFVLARLEANGLRPAPSADPRTLIRRVTFDLTGLPPTPAEVEAFVNDPSPGAYARLVDRLLASPAYGERWGRHWLDLVRYCDSFDGRIVGNAMDCADAWRYRDWVVRALNADLPYDRFVRLQVAGDLTGDPDGLVATGMLALGNWGGGDADKDKLLTDIADDQVDVIGRSILGLTVACARCHDHKFDPVSTKDYYALAGIFFSTHILPNVGPKTDGPPMLRVPIETPAEAARRREATARVAAVDAEVASLVAERRAALMNRLKAELPAHLRAARAGAADGPGLDPLLLRLCRPAFAPARGTVLARHTPDLLGKPGLHGWRGTAENPSAVANATDAEVLFLSIAMPPRTVAVHPGPASDVAVVWTSATAGEVTASGRLTDFDPTCGDGFAWELRHAGAGGPKGVASGTAANGQSAEVVGGPVRVAAGDRLELVVKRRGEYTCDTTGVALTVRGAGQTWDFAADWLAAVPAGAARVGPWGVEDATATAHPPAVAKALADWTDDRPEPADALAAAILAADGVPLLPATGLPDELLSAADRGKLASLRGEATALRKELSTPRPMANAAQEGGVPGSPHAGVHDVRVHVRGRYDRLGDVVPRGFPAAVRVADPPAIASGSGRRELADWLTRPDHPLTARVIVNRVWQHHFGEGLVRTPSNFGTLGEPPTHPELLDHLATRFIAGGWSLKALHRYVLLSATYRQSSRPAHAAEPDNRLLGHYPRRRLEAEAIRDSLLAAAGRLDMRQGGPAVRDFAAPRRTLYLMTVRSDRSGFGPLFDAADSTAPVDRRTTSTVAPQALFLMNDPFVKAQAAAFAARVRSAATTDDRLRFASTVAFGRPPSEAELALGREFVAAGTDAAWAAWCHLLMQANEFVTVE